MAEDESIEPIRPLRNLLIGIATPAFIVAFCIGLFVGIDALTQPMDWEAFISAVRLGIVFGALGSLVGVADVVFGLLFFSVGRWMNRVYRVIGFLLIWSVVVGTIFS